MYSPLTVKLEISNRTFYITHQSSIPIVPSLDDTAEVVEQRQRSESGSSTGSQSPVLQRSRQEVFIRSFVFQPELPIRIDYEAKGFKTEMVRGINEERWGRGGGWKDAFGSWGRGVVGVEWYTCTCT